MMNTRKNKKNAVDAELGTLATPLSSVTPSSSASLVFANESISKIWHEMDRKIAKLTEGINQQFLQFGLLLKEGENKLADDIKTTVKEAENRLLNEIDSIVNKMLVDLNDVTERVAKLEAVAVEHSGCKDQINKLKTQNSKYTNMLVACDLRISGVPYRPEENLHTIFDSICNVIKISTPVVQFIRRFQDKRRRNNNLFSTDGAIIVRLMTPNDRSMVLKAVKLFKKEHKCLALNLIGFVPDGTTLCNFYVNENLTNENYKILRQANTLKKKKVLQSVFTFKGLVYVKRPGTEDPICIMDFDELYKFFHSHDETMSNNSHNSFDFNLHPQ